MARATEALRRAWQDGNFCDIPLEPPHDRGIFSVDINETHIATGSADHGIRIWDAKNGKYLRELYNKRYGHKEWVTTLQYAPSGR